MNRRIVVDGRVFATEASDRGMGRYVRQLCAYLAATGYQVTLVVPGTGLDRAALPGGLRTQRISFQRDIMAWTAELNRYLASCEAAFYVDATPFLPPDRYDIYACPVVAVLYDVIPLRFPGDYFESLASWQFTEYVNGLARVQKADHVVAISAYVKRHALRYLGIASARCSVVRPDVGVEYHQVTLTAPFVGPECRAIVAIQGAHRSKNFPNAIGFLNRLANASGCPVEIVVPTNGQRARVEDLGYAGNPSIRISHSVDERKKFELQRSARMVAHLSLDEGYGIPLAEALYLHRPVICVDNAINREVVGEEDPSAAGILFLRDTTLQSDKDLRAAASFAASGNRIDFRGSRERIVARLDAWQGDARAELARALDAAAQQYEAWHRVAGLALASPTDFGSCGVSDYCHALARCESPRYLVLLDHAPRELQLLRRVRLLPVSLLEDARQRVGGVLFNLAISPTLSRGFASVTERSSSMDVLVVHDAGSYLPGLLTLASMSGNWKRTIRRWIRDESERVHELVRQWFDGSSRTSAELARLRLQLDRNYRSIWLRTFRGKVISHHPAFQGPGAPDAERILDMLAPQSELRVRVRFAPMPIDARATPGLGRLAQRTRWVIGLNRKDLLVCCAGSVVRGKFLDVVARAVVQLNEDSIKTLAPMMTLMLAGRIIDDSLFAELRREFSASGQAAHLIHIVEPDEIRYDALLAASDMVVALREQRYIQMSHSFIRALALGRPIVTNAGAGFGDEDVVALCRDEHLVEDLAHHLKAIRDGAEVRAVLARAAQSRYRASHTLTAFFANLEGLEGAATSV